MSATIKRGTPARRPVQRRKVAKRSLGDRIVSALPISEATLRHAATAAILLVGAGAAVAAASVLGVPAMVGSAVDDVAGRAGLRVETIQVTGNKRADLMAINALALESKSLAMTAVDLNAVRERLVSYGGWIADAHVSRRWPDTLLIQIDERTPAAVWQNEGQLTLVDASGALLEAVDPNRMPNLPLVIGPGADRQEAGYQALLAAAPALRPRVKAATWVGGRRWDLTFTTGETLALPEGEHESATALGRFAQIEGARAVLGKGWLRFDLRDPTKLVARRPGSGAQALSDTGSAGVAVPARAAGSEPRTDEG
ncbi:cell division protein FtsQ/DivIB [uncultured Sphingomonas sp.]|uniref:cell division protein FtsQ/DivIB n=1 Tax=uncultured Sphingomonas sp. TaxID=158754 RepID=UPI0035CA17C4